MGSVDEARAMFRSVQGQATLILALTGVLASSLVEKYQIVTRIFVITASHNRFTALTEELFLATQGFSTLAAEACG